MRVKNIQISLLIFHFWISSSWALDTSEEEQACISIGFKIKTPTFGSCVLELLDRRDSQAPYTHEDQICLNYGFRKGTSEYASCKQQIDTAKQISRRQEEQYLEQKRQYEELVNLQKEKERREKNQRALDLSLRLMNGQNPTDALLSTGSGTPIPPRAPVPQTIILPNGRGVICTTQTNVTVCN